MDDKTIYKVFIIVCLIALAASLHYIAKTELQKARFEAEYKGQEIGFRNGYTSAIQQLVKGTANCNVASIAIGNQSIGFVDTRCLQQPSQ